MLKSGEDGERGQDLAVSDGSMERWCSSQSVRAQNDSGPRRRGGVERADGEPRCREQGACPGNQAGNCMAGPHRNKATKGIRAIHEEPGMPG